MRAAPLGQAPSLELPIRDGVTYIVHECSAEAWLRFQDALDRLDQAAATVNVNQLQRIARENHVTDVELYREALGEDVWQQMLTDGLSRREAMFCGQTAWLWQLGRHDAAEAFWDSGGKASAPTTAPNSTSSSTDEVSTPPSSTGGSTTTSPTTSRPSSTGARGKGKGRRGPGSSPTTG